MKILTIKKLFIFLLSCVFCISIANAKNMNDQNIIPQGYIKHLNWELGPELGLRPGIHDMTYKGGIFWQYHINNYFALESGVGYDGIQENTYRVHGLYIKGGIRIYLLKHWNLGLFYKPYIPLNAANVSYSDTSSVTDDMASKASIYWGQFFFDFGFKTSSSVYINIGISTLINHAEWEKRNDFNKKGDKNIDISGLKSIKILPYIFLRYDVLSLFKTK